MLRGAAEQGGHTVEVVDLAIEVVRALAPAHELARHGDVAGDHDKNEPALREAHHTFMNDVARALGRTSSQVRTMRLDWPEIARALDVMARSPWARTAAERLAETDAPQLVGISVMFADQLLAALVVARIARRVWREVPVVLGGTHVTAMADVIASDVRYGDADSAAIDGFVAGYAEHTFVDLLDAIDRDECWPRAVFRAGGGCWHRAAGDVEVVPRYGSVVAYQAGRLTLPAQVSRGCSYGVCAFCTYPHVEGEYARARSLGHAPAVLELAARHGAVLSFKDALLGEDVLADVAALVRGRVPWAGCTKLASGLAPLMPQLAASGCRTLEIGVESVLEPTQRLIRKRQPHALLLRTLDAAHAAGVKLVLNYMTGLPGEEGTASLDGLRRLTELASARGFVVEHHAFELERCAPLAERRGDPHLAVGIDRRMAHAAELGGRMSCDPLLALGTAIEGAR